MSFPSYLQMSETQIANELLHGNLCGSQHFLFKRLNIALLIQRGGGNHHLCVVGTYRHAIHIRLLPASNTKHTPNPTQQARQYEATQASGEQCCRRRSKLPLHILSGAAGESSLFCVRIILTSFAGNFNDPSGAFSYMYQYHLQAAKVVDHHLQVNNKRRADETEAEDQEQ